MPAKPYNGHPSWNAWNVSLWLSNDEYVYTEAMRLVAKTKLEHKPWSYHRAARILIHNLGLTRTPDGARYSINSVKLALQGLE